jgi:hypothetical protein
MVLVELRRYDEAAAVARELPEPQRAMMLSFVAAMKDPAQADAAVPQIMAHNTAGVTGKALMLAMLGKNDLALNEMERQFTLRDPYREFLYAIRQYDPMHKDPRFRALMKQVGLPTDAEGNLLQGQGR